MDNHLELLMDHSALSAKAALLAAMLPLTKPAEVKRDLIEQLSSTELDEVLAMCGAMDQQSLTTTAHILDAAAAANYSWKGFRSRALYGPAVAPLMGAFRPGDDRPELEIVRVIRFMAKRVDCGAVPEETPLATKLAIVRGICIRMYTSGMDAPSNEELFWLGTNHLKVVPIAEELRERKSSDPLLITEMSSQVQKPLLGGVL